MRSRQGSLPEAHDTSDAILAPPFQVLGFDAPSFTHGTDLLLPIGANADLRAELHISGDEAADRSSDSMEELTSVPQVSQPL